MRRLSGALAACVVTLAACDPPPAPDRIVFSSLRPGNWDVYAIPSDGGPSRRLTDHPGLDYEPAVSPDGRWLIFTSERRGSPDLFALDLANDGAMPRLLIDSPAMEDQAAFFPDGRTLAFVSSHSGNADIYVLPFLPDRPQSIDAAVNLTRHPGGDFRPAVSPAGDRIAFSTDRDSVPRGHPLFRFARQREGEIYAMDVDGRNATRLTHMDDWDGSPAWSTDGKTIFFYSAGGERRPPTRGAPSQHGGFRVWSLEPDDPRPRQVSPDGIEALWPAMSPDGRIAFATRSASGFDARWTIASIDSDGTDLLAESDTTHSYWAPAFHPTDGTLFVHGTGEEPDVLPGCGLKGRFLAGDFPVSVEAAGKPVQMYGMRHPFSVPPHPTRDRVLAACEDSDGDYLVSAATDGSAATELVRFDAASLPRGRPMGMKWSRDGAWVSYMFGRFGGAPDEPADVWRVAADGGDPENLTASDSSDGWGDFSGDGRALVIRSGRSGAFDLYLIAIGDGVAQALTDDPARDLFPAHSPTENLIAFVSDRDAASAGAGEGPYDVYTLSYDGSGPSEVRRITENPGQDAHVQFSADGRWLVFTSEQGGINDEEPLVQELLFNPQMYGEIYAYRLADGHLVRLTHNKWEDGAPFWVGPVSESGMATPY